MDAFDQEANIAPPTNMGEEDLNQAMEFFKPASSTNPLRHQPSQIMNYLGENAYKCNQCDEAFSYKSALKTHKRKHILVKPYQCPKCEAGFYNNSSFMRHIMTHTGEKPFQCSQCDKVLPVKVI